MSKVAILGAGPSGLLAAHAARIMGATAHIYSRREKSQIYGAQYLHRSIPGVKVHKFQVDYQMHGTPEEYRQKVYGDKWDGTVSPEDYPRPHPGWDIRQAYDILWEDFGPRIVDVRFASFDHVKMYINLDEYDHIFSTVPRTIFGQPGDKFEGTDVLAKGGAKGEYLLSMPEFTVMCNGNDAPAWYRAASVNGYQTLEWPGTIRRIPIPGVAKIKKPLRYVPGNAENEANKRLTFVGRYGAWEKGLLTSDVFNDVIDTLS